MAYDGGVGRVYTTAASPWFIEEIGFEFRERGVLLDDVSRLAGIIDALTRATKRLEARADALSLTDDELALAHAHREATSGRGAIQHAPDDELDGQVLLPTRRKARLDGFDLDAEVAVAAPPTSSSRRTPASRASPPSCRGRARTPRSTSACSPATPSAARTSSARPSAVPPAKRTRAGSRS
jgi:hypothetical protein